LKILNCFAGIGGNRSLWGDKHEITAVEYNKDVAGIYQKRFSNDKIIIGDAYEYLVEHYKEFDFIWASPPCQTHTRLNEILEKKKLIDFKLYSIILHLQSWFKGKWIVENVIPYYKKKLNKNLNPFFQPLIKPTIILGRHPFWTNFYIKPREFKIPEKYRINLTIRSDGQHRRTKYTELTPKQLCEIHRIDWDLVKDFKPKNWVGHDAKKQILRNCVLPELGKYILDQSKNKIKQNKLVNFMEAK